MLALAESTSRAELGLGRADAAPPAAGVVLWFYVDDIDAVTASAVAAGATLVEEPVDMPWGERVSLVLDPLGAQVHFGAR